jgi:hypothetical protein
LSVFGAIVVEERPHGGRRPRIRVADDNVTEFDLTRDEAKHLASHLSCASNPKARELSA